jgi:hypothetical protein
LVLADLHCGHKVGFTPPDFDKRPGSGYGSRESEQYKHRSKIFRHFKPVIIELSPDIVILNGDLIDGRGDKSGSTELITTDRGEQCDMATAVIRDVTPQNPEFVMSYGTAYHTGELEDWEDQIFDSLNAKKISAEDNIRVRGKAINYRHHAGRSSIPHGKGTPLSKEWLWNALAALRGEYPKAAVVIRSHNHYFFHVGDADYIAVSTPALQGYGTKFGARRATGLVDVGVCWLDVYADGRVVLDWHVMRFRNKHKYAMVVE